MIAYFQILLQSTISGENPDIHKNLIVPNYSGVITKYTSQRYRSITDGHLMKWLTNQLITSFEGESLKLLSQFSEFQNYYNKLIDALDTHFEPVERSATYKVEFFSQSRRKHESIMDFAAELRRLVTRAYPDQPSSAQESLMIDQFIMGLGCINLKRHVQFGHPNSVQVAISLAVEAEAFEMVHGTGNSCKSRADVCVIQSMDEVSDAGPDGVACAVVLQESSGKYKKKNIVNGKYHQQINNTKDSCYKL